MYCKHCGKEIPDDARFCAGCGKSISDSAGPVELETGKKKKKKGKKKHPILGTIVLIFGIILIVGALAGNDEPQKVESSAPAATQAAVAEATEAPVFTVGDTLEIGDILVTLMDVSENKGSQFFTPTDGNVFVTCEFIIENNSNSEMAVSSIMSFECYFDDYAANISLGAMSADQSKQQLDGTVAPGKKISGVVGYEAPADWTDMEVHFKSSLYTIKPFVFNYSK